MSYSWPFSSCYSTCLTLYMYVVPSIQSKIQCQLLCRSVLGDLFYPFFFFFFGCPCVDRTDGIISHQSNGLGKSRLPKWRVRSMLPVRNSWTSRGRSHLLLWIWFDGFTLVYLMSHLSFFTEMKWPNSISVYFVGLLPTWRFDLISDAQVQPTLLWAQHLEKKK